MGRNLGSNRKRVATTLGLTTGQGIVDRITANRRKLTISRGEPHPVELAAAHDPDLAARQQLWLDHHHAHLNRARARLLTHTALASDEAYDWLHEVAADPWVPTTMTLMIYAIEELRGSPAVAQLTDDHPLHTALADWSALAENYHRIH